eukprot:TRINITY_DN6821_c1_g1_i1.p1 TRINITY_DN6821_c1_g1~~TRINITY_DN6821_c1_g1_i1.p1  ORF type:complete len:3085 (+),score=971.89 TRINITY_DN6821_c1_g1_i1:65-9319(+)
MGQLERRVAAQFAQAQRQRLADLPAAKRALMRGYELLKSAQDSACGEELFLIGPDLWLYAAEAAAAVDAWEVVDHCVRQLVEVPPTRSALLCRFLFVDGLCRARRSTGKDVVVGAKVKLTGLGFPLTHLNRRTASIVEVRPQGVVLDVEPVDDEIVFPREHLELISDVGEAFLDTLHQAISCIVRAVQLAQADPALGHLVVQGAEHYWNVVRSAFRVGTRRELAGSMQKIVDALEAIGYEQRDPLSRATWMLRLALCKQEADGDQAARDTVLKAAADAEKRGLDSIKYPLQRLRLSLKAGGDGKGAGAEHEKAMSMGIAACQAVYAALGAAEEVQEKALTDAFSLVEGAYQELSKLCRTTDKGADKKPGGKAAGGGGGGGGGGGKEPAAGAADGQREREEMLTELGLLASMVGTDGTIFGCWRLLPKGQFQDDPSADAPLLFREHANAVKRARALDVGVNASHYVNEAGVVTENAQRAAENTLGALAIDVGGLKSEVAPGPGKGAKQADRRGDLAPRPARSLRARVFQEYIAAVLTAQRAAASAIQREPYSNRLGDAMRKQLGAAVRGLEKALQSAARTGDTHLLQIGCVLIWNLSLPLLNDGTRRLVAKPLQSALQTLEACGSNLHQLRVEILHELACCDIADEFLQKANQRVTAALGIDYVFSPPDPHGVRPLDRFLQPLKDRLDLKADIYYVPDHAAAEGDDAEYERITREEVTLLVDQAQETKNPVELRQMLDRAIELMEGTEPPRRPEDSAPREERVEAPDAKGKGKPPLPPKKGGGEEAPPRVQTPEELLLAATLRARAVLWDRVATLAHRANSSRLIGTLRQAVHRLLRRQWTDAGDRDLRAAQARGCLAYAQSFISELQTFEGRSLRIGQRMFVTEGGEVPDESEERRLRAEVQKAQEGVNEYTKLALQFAGDLVQDGDRWLVVNAAVQYHNWHAALFLDNDLTQDDETAVSVPRDADSQTADAIISREMGRSLRSSGRRVWSVVAVDHRPLAAGEDYASLLAAAEQDPVEVIVRKPADNPMCDVLGQLFRELVELREMKPPYRQMKDGAQCPSQEIAALAGIADAYVRALVQQYIRSKLEVATEDEVIEKSAHASTFPIPAKPEDTEKHLERAAEVCRVMVTLFPCPMDACAFHTQMAIVRRFQMQKSPELEQVRPAGLPAAEAQEKVVIALELLRQRNNLVAYEDVRVGAVIRMTPRGFRPGPDYADVAPVADVFTGSVLKKEGGAVAVKWNNAEAGGPPNEVNGRLVPRETAEPSEWWDGDGAPRADDDKARLLRGALDDLVESPNVELCARLADRALQPPAYVKLAVRIAHVAKGLHHAGNLGVRQKPPKAAEADVKPKKADPKKGAPAVTGTFVADKPPPPQPGPMEFMWYCQCLQSSGRATAILINPQTQEKATQNELRRRALEDFATAAEFALKGRADTREENLVQCVRLFHATARPFTGAAVTRGKMLPALARLMSVSVCGQLKLKDLPQDDHEAVLDLYLCLVQTYRDQTKWAEVETVMRQAFEHLPRAQHKPLWEADVQFRCKKGQSALRVRDQLRGVKAYDAQTQARAWLMLARCTAQRPDQLHALQQAVDVLEGEPGPQASALAALATWMYRNRQPSERCIDMLLCGADKLSDVVDVEPEAASDGRSYAATSQRGSGLMSVGSGGFGSLAGKSEAALRTRAGSMSVFSAAGALSAGGGPEGGTVTSTGPTLQQLCVMASIYVLLDTVAGPQYVHHHQYLQLAVSYYTGMLHTTAHGLERRHAHDQKRARRRRRRSQHQSGGTGAAEGDEGAVEVPSITFPTEPGGWVGWQPPAAVVDYLRRGKGDSWVLGPASLDDPGFVCATLRMLITRLRAEDMYLETLPVLILEQMLLNSAPIHRYTRARALCRNALEWTGAHDQLAASAVGAASGPPPAVHLDEGDRQELVEDLRQMIEQPPVPPASGSGATEEAEECTGCLHSVWIDEAALLISAVRLTEAKVLLREAVAHAAAASDAPELARCHMLQARVARIEGRDADAVAHSDKALSSDKEHGGSVRLPADIVCELAILRAALADAQHGFDAAKAVIDAAEDRLLRCDERDCASDSFRAALVCSFAEEQIRQQKERLAAGITAGLTIEAEQALVERVTQATQLATGNSKLMAQCSLLRADLVGLRLQADGLLADDRTSLLGLKELMVEQRRYLERAAACAESLCSATVSQHHEITAVGVSHPARRLRAEVALREGANALARAGINRLLRQLHAAAPSATHIPQRPDSSPDRLPSYARNAADADGAQRVDTFMSCDVGTRFMTSTAKQRRAAARRVSLDDRRLARLRQLESEWRPGDAAAPPAEEARPTSAAQGATKPRPSGKLSKGAPPPPASPPAAPVTPATLPTEPDEATRAKWRQQTLDEYPSDDGEDSSSSDSEAEVARLDDAATGGAHDRFVTPSDAASHHLAALADAPHGSLLRARALAGAGRCARAAAEAAVDGDLRRRLARRGKPAQLVSAVSKVNDMWNTNPEPSQPAAADDAAEKQKKPPPKAAKGKEEAAPPPQQTEPAPEGSLKLFPPPTDDAAQSRSWLQPALEHLMATDEWSAASEVAHDLARVAVVQGERHLAVQCVALAQSLRMSDFALGVYRQSSFVGASEKVLLRQLDLAKEGAPQASVSERYRRMQQAVYDHSPLLRSLRVWKGSGPPPLPAADALPPKCWVVVLHLSAAKRHLYAAMFRPGGGSLALRRATVDARTIPALTDEVAAVDDDRVSVLNGDVTDPAFVAGLAERWAALCERTSALLEPAIGPLASALEKADGDAPMIILCPSPELLPLPIEAHPAFRSARAVTRDLSVWHAELRYEASAADKPRPEFLRYCVDVFDETDGKLMNSLLGDRPAPPAGWDGVAGSAPLDGSQQRRQPSAAEMQKLLALLAGPKGEPPANGASAPCVVAVTGRLGSAIDVRHLAGLDLSHQRCLMLLDRVVNAGSHRRESGQDTRKTPSQLQIESSHCVAVLLLCRGTTGLVSSRHCIGVSANNAVLKNMVAAVEKGQSAAEWVQALKAARRRRLTQVDDGGKGAKPAPKQAKPEKGAQELDPELLALSPSDTMNLVVWGLP